MGEMEYRNHGDRHQARWSLTPLALGLIVLAVALVAIVVASGTAAHVDISIPTRLYPGG
jgi:hypothetical protein